VVDKQEFVKPGVEFLGEDDMQHIQLTYITHFYFDQKKPDTLIDLLKTYEGYPKELLDVMHFVIVDDCSPLRFNMPETSLNLTWLRISDDITWNQGGARNLGAVYAKSDKILLTDLDFIYPVETLKKMVSSGNPGKRFYKIRIKDPQTGKAGKGHSNNFFMSRARFLRLFGYDEEYSGGYGAEDYRFVKYQKAHGSWQRYLSRQYTCSRRTKIDRDAAYHSLNRDFSRNTPIDRRKRSELIYYGAESGHSRMFLNFAWDIVGQQRRPKIARKPNRLWKPMWILRTLLGSYD
jgi:hypothetical protein